MSTLRLTTISNQGGTASVPSDTVINGSAKAWVNFNGTGTVAIRQSFNVSSITDNGVGDYTVNFTTAMPDANYAVMSSAFENVGLWVGGIFGGRSANTPTTTSVRGSCVSYSGNYVDPAYVNVSIFR